MTDARTARGYRRAAVLIKHRIHGNPAGINAILDEVAEDGQTTPLIAGILGTFDTLNDKLVTLKGKDAIADLIEDMSTRNDLPEPHRRAARFLVAVDHDDGPGIDAVIGENGGEVSGLIVGLVDVISKLVPTVCSIIGIDILETAIIELSGMEAEGDE